MKKTRITIIDDRKKICKQTNKQTNEQQNILWVYDDNFFSHSNFLAWPLPPPPQLPQPLSKKKNFFIDWKKPKINQSIDKHTHKRFFFYFVCQPPKTRIHIGEINEITNKHTRSLKSLFGQKQKKQIKKQ